MSYTSAIMATYVADIISLWTDKYADTPVDHSVAKLLNTVICESLKEACDRVEESTHYIEAERIIEDYIQGWYIRKPIEEIELAKENFHNSKQLTCYLSYRTTKKQLKQYLIKEDGTSFTVRDEFAVVVSVMMCHFVVEALKKIVDNLQLVKKQIVHQACCDVQLISLESPRHIDNGTYVKVDRKKTNRN